MQYLSPETVEEAVSLLNGASGSIRVMSGGTDLLVQLRSGRLKTDAILDLKRIAELSTIAEEEGGYRIGSAVPSAEMGEHVGLSRLWPGVVEGAGLIGSTQVQGRATLVGNLCNASPAADSVPAMVAARAVARIVGPSGTRDVPVEEIPAGPGKTKLAKGEFVASIFLPARPKGAGDAYMRFIPRTEMDIAVVGVGINLTVDGSGVITDARVALGAVAPTVVVSDAGAKALVGSKLDEEALDRLAEAVSADSKPIDDKRGTREFRIKVAGTIARRVAAIAYERARENR